MGPASTKTAGHERRCFIRHPSGIPVHCTKDGHLDASFHVLRDISHGGLQFTSADAFVPGDLVHLDFPSLNHGERIAGEIMWTSAADDDDDHPFLNGMRFLHDDMRFRARLVEQICHIEAYRSAQAKRGRTLTHQAAAAEWIQHNA
ncbi:MAG: PilZ domain-containing protein, partial [Verrucomicrobia bacterium]|nr:PilZ domain-containing protein [Verrucomicrobiota bacterium]